jgi:hypothetical protein
LNNELVDEADAPNPVNPVVGAFMLNSLEIKRRREWCKGKFINVRITNAKTGK